MQQTDPKPAGEKKPYAKPLLVTHGSVQELTEKRPDWKPGTRGDAGSDFPAP